MLMRIFFKVLEAKTRVFQNYVKSQNLFQNKIPFETLETLFRVFQNKVF